MAFTEYTSHKHYKDVMRAHEHGFVSDKQLAIIIKAMSDDTFTVESVKRSVKDGLEWTWRIEMSRTIG